MAFSKITRHFCLPWRTRWCERSTYSEPRDARKLSAGDHRTTAQKQL